MARCLRAASLALAVLVAAPPVRADPYMLTPADRHAIEVLLRSFFEATRDGDRVATAATFPSHTEFVAIFLPGADAMLEYHLRAVQRDVDDLRTRFAHGVWVGVASPFAPDDTVTMAACGQFAQPTSRCVDGPVVDWRAGGQVQHLRIDRLVRIGDHWRIYDPRL